MPETFWADFGITITFVIAMWVVFMIGRTLARKGDALSRATGLGGSWVGLVFLACATSMPELITGVATAAVMEAPDLAMGNILGSCLFNIAIITVMDALWKKGPVLRDVSRSQVYPAAFGIVIIGLGAAGLFFVSEDMLAKEFGLGFGGAIVICYLASIRFMYVRRPKGEAKSREEARKGPDRRRVLVSFAFWCFIMVLGGLALSWIGDEVSRHEFGGRFRFGATAVGTFFLAAATSLPELSVSITAARLGAVDMAIGNVLGSNLFNLAVIPICEVAVLLTGAPAVLYNASPVHLLTAGISILMTLIVVLALRFRPKLAVGRMGIESILIGLIYIAGSIVIFLRS